MASLYLATTDGGFEEILSAEVAQQGGIVKEIRQGKVVFERGTANLSTLRKLKCAHAILAFVRFIENVPKDRAALEILEAALLDKEAWEPALLILQEWRPDLRGRLPTFRVTAHRRCSVRPKHQYSSIEISGFVGSALHETMRWPVRMENFDVEVQAWVRTLHTKLIKSGQCCG
ncbi:hypothetical protein CYMTET_11304 [Cymbomonas tetramitiformis]|uniref:Uncharacterized protein n=1 Tax=Cymbomonas tetramitiformis TaxID=36881 RepID=A0AAE0LD50_9CHLO|nr:hypothetical protein CYMTET_11304 [Cymbomonas tetramitiformis]